MKSRRPSHQNCVSIPEINELFGELIRAQKDSVSNIIGQQFILFLKRYTRNGELRIETMEMT